jgi:hypothetical protein
MFWQFFLKQQKLHSAIRSQFLFYISKKVEKTRLSHNLHLRAGIWELAPNGFDEKAEPEEDEWQRFYGEELPIHGFPSIVCNAKKRSRFFPRSSTYTQSCELTSSA